MFIGIDLGGTSVKVGLVSVDGELLHRSQRAITDREASAVISLCAELAHECVEGHGVNWSVVSAVGIGCPGQLSQGIIHAAANFPNWTEVALEHDLHILLGVPTVLVNDADAAVAAEHWVGAAAEVKNFLMLSTLTLGTGVGFGIVNNDEIVSGGTGCIEGGHIIMVPNGRLCGCSQRGCLEAYSSATALIGQAKLRATNSEVSSALSSVSVDEINAKMIFEFAANGDQVCKELIDEVGNDVADYLGLACVNFCRTLDPEMIVFSGGIAEAGESFIQLIREAYNKYTWTRLPNPVVLKKASVGYDSGILGAAAFAFRLCAKRVASGEVE
ncbi:glucokinase [Thraustotheca clavata]|uniref:Glucokinase n=1 Tax=Thraustotheca clavata TaxID=74557 RepID=A0A1W0A0Q9_9STRA|nr:glucokinase [Thraustotheca clavata]